MGIQTQMCTGVSEELAVLGHPLVLSTAAGACGCVDGSQGPRLPFLLRTNLGCGHGRPYHPSVPLRSWRLSVRQSLGQCYITRQRQTQDV